MTFVKTLDMNSILEAAKKEDDCLSAEISLMIRSHTSDNKTLIVVEGRSDRTVYSSFYEKENFDIYCSQKFSGCVNFDNALTSLNRKYPTKFIIIKDGDFEILDKDKVKKYSNLFLTDTHDLETLMFCSTVFKAFADYYNISKPEEFILGTCRDIINLSYTKWINHKQNLKLSFKKSCRIGSCYEGDEPTSVATCLEKLYLSKSNEGKTVLTELYIHDFIRNHEIEDSELLKITNGHDLITALTIKLRKVLNTNINKKDLEKLLIDNFNITEYKKTELSNNIDKWLEQNMMSA